jgi:hypothetical protein
MIAGQLRLLRDGRVAAELNDFELEGERLEFTLQVPLPEQLLSQLTRSLSPLSAPVPASPPDGSLRVSWAHGSADEVGLHLPARGQAFARAQVRYGQPPGEPTLEWVRCSIEGSKWQHRLKFRPLPAAGELTFRFSSPLLDVKNAVGVVGIANLRSRSI